MCRLLSIGRNSLISKMCDEGKSIGEWIDRRENLYSKVINILIVLALNITMASSLAIFSHDCDGPMKISRAIGAEPRL
jgi:hypothetical protein